MILALQIAMLLVSFAGSAFFSGIETGVISINRLRLMHQSRNGSRRARVLEGFLRQTDRLLGTTLVGNNLANVTIATVAVAISGTNWGGIGQIIAGLLSAVTVLIFGEFLPKAWFTSRPLERCLPLAGVLRGAEIVLRPLATFIMFLTRWATTGNSGKHTPFVTREHLHILTRDSEAGGQISTFERLMIGRVLDMQLKTAADIMTPLDKVDHVTEMATVADAIDAFKSTGHMKIPVFNEDRSQCLGVFYMQEVLAKVPQPGQEQVAKHIKPPFFIKDAERADDVLPLLRRNRQHIAMIRDNAGKVLGIVTIENVLKILVGNLPFTSAGNRKGGAPAALASPTAPLG